MVRAGYYAWVDTSKNQDSKIHIETGLRSAGCQRIVHDDIEHYADQRIELTSLIKQLQPNQCLYVWSLTCLGMDAIQLIELIIQLKKRAVCLVSVKDNLDSGHIQTDQVISLLGQLDQEVKELRKGKSGRPIKMTSDKLATAEKMLEHASREEVASQLGVSASTLYRLFPATKGKRKHK